MYFIVVIISFVLVYTTRLYLAYSLVNSNIGEFVREDVKKMIWHIYSIENKNSYSKSISLKIKIINFFSKLCYVLMVINFISIFIYSLIRDM